MCPPPPSYYLCYGIGISNCATASGIAPVRNIEVHNNETVQKSLGCVVSRQSSPERRGVEVKQSENSSKKQTNLTPEKCNLGVT